MTTATSRVALVTGCSSGIGRATALALRRAGYLVYASARRPQTLADLAGDGLVPIRLDVTDDGSMTAAVSEILTRHGHLDVLVNNAGYKVLGPVEEVPPEEVRRQFDTNLLGVARLTQLVLPGMRERGTGWIVNMSSVYGRFAVPGGAYPAATKHALAGFSDALRLEVAPFGVKVILIEPTATRTNLDDNAVLGGQHADGPYAAFNDDVVRWHHQAVSGPPYNLAGRLAVSAEQVAAAVVRSVTARNPHPRYPVGVLARMLFLLRRWLPPRGFDAFVRRQFPIPAAAPVRRAMEQPRRDSTEEPARRT
jgi:NAD(P)-dependent dehydrogenase (short-subunit alcohol dehydrogenase family)